MDQETVDRLVKAAAEARGNAHAPYSHYAVGAAVLTADGRIFAGCNVENASYGLGVCAERNAVAAAVAAGTRELVGLVVVTGSTPPASPCGACRQVMAEFGDFPVVVAGVDGIRRTTTVGELLPMPFLPDDLDPEA
jgi:cytidine deaminase